MKKNKILFDLGDIVKPVGVNEPIMKVTTITLNSDETVCFYCVGTTEADNTLEYGPFTGADLEIYKEKK